MADDTEKRVNVKYILDSSGFNDELKGINQNLKLNKSELKDAEAGVKAFGTSTENLTKVQKALGDTIESQSKKVALYQESITKMQTKMEENIAVRDKLQASLDMEKAKLESSIQAYGKDSEVTQNAKAKVAELTAELDKKNTAVESNAKSINNYTTNLNKADAELKRMQGDLAATNKQIAAQNDTWAGVSKNLENGSKSLKTVSEGANKVGDAFLKVGAPIVAADAVGAKLFMDFDDGMGKIATIADTSSENLGKMGNQVIDLSNKTGQSTNVLQEALYETISSGVQTGDAMNFLSNATKTAVGGFTDANTAVDGLTTVLNAYGLQASNATKISNQMIVAQNLGKTTFGEMAKSIGLVADTTANMNVKTQDLFSSLAVETAHGIDTSEAISGLREALSNIIKPTDDATKQAKSLGLEFNAAHLKSVGWAEFLKEVAEKTHGNTTEMGQLFGSVQGLNTMITLTSESGMSLFNQSLQQMSSNTDYVGQAFDKVQNTAGNKFKNSLNELKNSMIKLGEASEPIINDLSSDLKVVAGALNGMDKSTLQNITTIGLWTVGVGGALKVLAGVGNGISSVLSASSKVTELIGKKTLENTLKSNTKAETENTESININTGSKNINTESQASNTAATNINTAAQEANSKAMSKTVASEGISTAAKEASTIAEGENTAATVANEAAQVKGSKGILGTAKNFIGLGTAATGAGEAVAGAGTAATGAGEATAGMGTAATGASVSLGVVAVAAAGVALAGYGIYKAYKYTTDQTVPQVDLFGDSVVSTATKVKAQNGTVATQMKDTTVSISNSTKQAISSYMDMDKKVSKSMQDIYVNSNNFSKQEKNSVISAYTDMANKVTSLTGSNKTAVLNNFKEMVSNTTTLTSQSRSQIVAQYTQMVNQVTGLTAQQKQKVIKDFSDSLKQASGITQSQATGIIDQFTQMGNKINSAINNTDQKQLKSVQDLFSKTTTISNTEQADILQSMQKHDTSKKAEANIYEQQIADIMTKAINNHGQITQQDWQTMNDIRQRMQTLAVQTMSKSEVEQKVIMQRLKDYNGQMTLAQASDTIQNAEKQRKGAVDAANKEYNEKLATIIQMRDGSHQITSQQADDMIKEAKRQRDQSVKEADGQKKEVVDKVKQMNSSAVSELDTGTGKQLDVWQKLERGIGGIINSISSKWNSTMSSIFGNHSINVTTNIKGSSNGYSGGAVGQTRYTMNAAGGVFTRATQVTLAGNPYNVVGEAGNEAVIPLKDDVLAGIGKGIVEATAQLKNNKVGIEFEDNSDKSIKFGENTMKNIAAGMKHQTNLLSSVAENAGTVINTGLNKAYTDIFTVFKDKLGTSVDVISNKAIAVSNTLANMVQPERNTRADIFSQLQKGTTTVDLALQSLQHTNDMLGVSTGDSEKDLRNMLGQMTNLSTMAVIADNNYLKLGKTVGWTDDKTQEMLKDYQDYQKQYDELGQKVVEEQQKINDSVSSSANDLFSKIKDSLKDYYSDMQSKDEDAVNQLIDNNTKWKDNALNNLEKVYNAKKDELDKEETDLDRNNSDEDDADKRAELERQLTMHLGAEQRKELQQQLDDLNKEENRRHAKEALDDQKDALDKQYKADQDNINATADANEANYKAQLTTIQNYYAEKQKDANLDAEAQKMIVENNQQDIISLLQKYGKDYEIAGASLGDRLVSGFKDKIDTLQSMLNSVVGQMNKIDVGDISSTTSLTSSTASTPAKSSNISNSLNSAMSKIAAEFKTNSANSGGTTIIQVPITLDGKQIAYAEAPYSNRIQGTNMVLEARGL